MGDCPVVFTWYSVADNSPSWGFVGGVGCSGLGILFTVQDLGGGRDVEVFRMRAMLSEVPKA